MLYNNGVHVIRCSVCCAHWRRIKKEESDEKVHEQVIEKIKMGMKEFGFKMVGVTDSPILGGKGNKEFLALFEK